MDFRIPFSSSVREEWSPVVHPAADNESEHKRADQKDGHTDEQDNAAGHHHTQTIGGIRSSPHALVAGKVAVATCRVRSRLMPFNIKGDISITAEWAPGSVRRQEIRTVIGSQGDAGFQTIEAIAIAGAVAIQVPHRIDLR